MKILIAEGTSFFNKTLKKLLKEAGFELVIKTNASLALSEFKKNPWGYIAIITVMNTSVMTGLELTQAVRNLENGNILIIMLSEVGVRKEWIKEAGVDFFSMLPIGEDIIKKVMDLFEKFKK